MKIKFILVALLAMLIKPAFGQTYEEYQRNHLVGETFEQYTKRVNPSLGSQLVGAAVGTVANTVVNHMEKQKEAEKKTFKVYPVIEPEAVDLGLPSGVLWGSFNLGATKPEEGGNRYAWGETKPRTTFPLESYKYYTPEKVTRTGGGKDADGFPIPVKEEVTPESWVFIGRDISGTEYDAARQSLGGDWRMPSFDDFEELEQFCKQVKIAKNDVNGIKFTGPNGNWIFLPEVFCQNYDQYFSTDVYHWTSTVVKSDTKVACTTKSGRSMRRDSGFPIRPVKGVAKITREERLKMQESINTPDNDETVYIVAEHMPVFPGGAEALFKYLNENVRNQGIQGRVICDFIVNKDGSISDIVVTSKGIDASLDREAVRVISEMPKWTPGQQGGKPVRCKYTVPVKFK